MNMKTITETKVQEAVNHMHNYKAAEFDIIFCEIFEFWDVPSIKILVVFFFLFSLGNGRNTWGLEQSGDTPYFKRGDRTVCSNYRGTALSLYIGKMCA